MKSLHSVCIFRILSFLLCDYIKIDLKAEAGLSWCVCMIHTTS